MKPNDKVVCINDDFREALNCEHRSVTGTLPVRDKVYVIEKVFLDLPDLRPGELGLRLVGTTSFYDSEEVGYSSFRFRKLDEMKASRKTAKPQIVAVVMDFDV